MSRYALRFLPSWPWTVGKPGELVGDGWMDTDRESLEEIRRASPNAEHYEVVELDDEGRVDGTHHIGWATGITRDPDDHQEPNP